MSNRDHKSCSNVSSPNKTKTKPKRTARTLTDTKRAQPPARKCIPYGSPNTQTPAPPLAGVGDDCSECLAMLRKLARKCEHLFERAMGYQIEISDDFLSMVAVHKLHSLYQKCERKNRFSELINAFGELVAKYMHALEENEYLRAPERDRIIAGLLLALSVHLKDDEVIRCIVPVTDGAYQLVNVDTKYPFHNKFSDVLSTCRRSLAEIG